MFAHDTFSSVVLLFTADTVIVPIAASVVPLAVARATFRSGPVSVSIAVTSTA